MNLRDIKKDIDYVLGNFVEDCLLFISTNPDRDSEEVTAVLEEAMDLYNDLKDKTAVRNIEGSKKAYFDSLRKELIEKVDALYMKLSSIIKEGKA